jgi:hypothetical protein
MRNFPPKTLATPFDTSDPSDTENLVKVQWPLGSGTTSARLSVSKFLRRTTLKPEAGFDFFVDLGSILCSQFYAIFDNFPPKMSFFSKTNVMLQFMHNLDLF